MIIMAVLVLLAFMTDVTSAAGTTSSCPSPLSPYLLAPSHCIGTHATGKSCSPPMKTKTCSISPKTGLGGCVLQAATACETSPGCVSFALRAGGSDCNKYIGPADQVEWHLYTATAGYPVNNSDWVAYYKPLLPTPPPPPPTPPPISANVQEMRCGVRQLAVDTAMERIGDVFGKRVETLTSSALRMNTDCDRESKSSLSQQGSTKPKKNAATTSIVITISPTGSDSNGTGSPDRPFQSPVRARDAIRSIRYQTQTAEPATVVVKSGKYHLGDSEPLVLTTQDNHVSWIADSGPCVFSGTTLLDSLQWTGFNGSIVKVQVPHNFTVLFDPEMERMLVRSRYPNGNPTDASGMCFMGGQLPFEQCNGYMKAHGTAPNTDFVGRTTGGIVFNTSRGGVVAGDAIYKEYNIIFQAPPNNLAGQGYPVAVCNQGEGGGELYNRSGSVIWGEEDDECFIRSANWSNQNKMVVHMMHNGWGNVFYSVKSLNPANRTILFERGGYQHGRQGDVSNFYIENALELLDAPGEWFLDSQTGSLYLWPNSTTPPASLHAATLETIVHINGSRVSPVKNISFTGITFAQTQTAFLKPYERPISGDWAIRRAGTVIVEGAEDVHFTGCNFSQTGGNGILFSRHVRASSVQQSEFKYIGDSAIVAFGDIDWQTGDARNGSYPSQLVLNQNLIHEVGVWGKQVSAFFQGVSGNNQFTNNVAFNGPRAMVNINDGMLGLSNISGNVLFNGCRESDDHGNFNSWDRTPMLHNASDSSGPASWTPGRSTVSKNIIINSYGAGHGIDHDDGSMEWDDVENVVAFSHACKGNYGSNRNCSGNIVLAPGLKSVFNAVAGGGGVCAEESNNGHGSTFANKYFESNTCVYLTDETPSAYIFASCKQSDPQDLNQSVWHTSGNRFLTTTGNLKIGCGGSISFADWQNKFGQDLHSTVDTLPPINSILDDARQLLSATSL